MHAIGAALARQLDVIVDDQERPLRAAQRRAGVRLAAPRQRAVCALAAVLHDARAARQRRAPPARTANRVSRRLRRDGVQTR